jgi:hypothetical protein
MVWTLISIGRQDDRDPTVVRGMLDTEPDWAGKGRHFKCKRKCHYKYFVRPHLLHTEGSTSHVHNRIFLNRLATFHWSLSRNSSTFFQAILMRSISIINDNGNSATTSQSITTAEHKGNTTYCASVRLERSDIYIFTREKKLKRIINTSFIQR